MWSLRRSVWRTTSHPDTRRCPRSAQDAREHAHGRGLAGAVRAHEPEDLAVGDVEIESGDGDEFTEGAAETEGANGGHRRE